MNDAEGIDPSSLLEEAIRDPLPESFIGSPLRDWMRELDGRFRLWAFDPFAYWSLQDTDWPSTFPLQAIINSITRDDGIPTDPPQPVPAPLATVDRRRGWLAGTATEGAAWQAHVEWSEDSDGTRSLRRARGPQLYEAPELFDPGHEGPYDYTPPHHEEERLGRQLIRLTSRVRAARAAGDSEEEEAAEEELNAFIGELIGKTGGRDREKPPDELLTALVREGEELFNLIWSVWPPELSDRTREVLGEEIPPYEESIDWALNLTLPVLSYRECRVLRSTIRRSQDWTRATGRPTPLRFSVFTVARRLHMAPASVADTATGGTTAARIRRMEDPYETSSE